MLPVNSLDDYLPWADSTEIISRFDRIPCLSVLILSRKYTKRYNIIRYMTSLPIRIYSNLNISIFFTNQ